MSNTRDFKVKNGIQPTVYHEGLGTVVSGSVGYNLAGASYDSVNFSVASEDTAPNSIAFNNDGTKLYMVGSSSDSLYQYSLSTAFDLSTISYDSVSFSVASQDTAPLGLAFNNDGTKFYMVGIITDSLYQYSLSTAFDLSTASYDSVSFSVAAQDSIPTGISFNNDGTKLYISGDTTNTIYQYSLSTAFDLSTASYDSVSFSVASQDTNPRDLAFNNDGTKFYIAGASSDSVHQYSLSTAFDLSTASYDSVSFSVVSQDINSQDIVFNTDGTKMYIMGYTNRTIYQYSTVLNTAELDLSTGSVFEVTPTSDIQVTLSNPADSGTVSGATLLLDGGAAVTYDLANAVYDSVSFSVASQDSAPYSLSFSADGTKMYVAGSTTDSAYQYSLSRAFDLSTASYDNVSFSFLSQDSGPWAITLSTDGTKMYLTGNNTDSVYQYTLSTAFDLATVSYDSISLNISAQDSLPGGITFSADGTKMYILGSGSDSVHQYSLSTAFDLSTASYDSVSFSVASQEANPFGIAFNNDGTLMFITGFSSDSVHQYSLSTSFDVSTASYDSVSFSVASQESAPRDVTFNTYGNKMYIVGSGSDTAYQYTVGTPATITYPSTVEWPGGTAPTSPAIGDTDVVTFNTRDGGSTYQGVLAIDGAK